MRDRFQRSRDLMTHGLRDAGFTVLDAAATYFLCVDLKASGIEIDDEAFAATAVEHAGVAVIPISAFRRAGAVAASRAPVLRQEGRDDRCRRGGDGEGAGVVRVKPADDAAQLLELFGIAHAGRLVSHLADRRSRNRQGDRRGS